MRKIKLVFINIAILLVLLLLCEAGLRIFKEDFPLYKRTRQRPNINKDNTGDTKKVTWPRPHDKLGWVCSKGPYLDFPHEKYGGKYYRINSEGFRNPIELTALRGVKKPKVLLLGDSFIMSVFLAEDETIAANLDSLSNSQIQYINLGIPGYGIDQALLAYEQYNATVKPETVILFYIDDDIWRILEAYRTTEGMNKPSFTIEGDSLVLSSAHKPSMAQTVFENSYFLNRFYRRYMEYYAIELSKRIFDRLIQGTRANGQKLIVFRCPAKNDFEKGQQYKAFSFKAFFEERDVDYVELFTEMKSLDTAVVKQLYLAYDGHPSPMGAKYFAKAIDKEIPKSEQK